MSAAPVIVLEQDSRHRVRYRLGRVAGRWEVLARWRLVRPFSAVEVVEDSSTL